MNKILKSILAFSLKNRYFVLFATVILLVAGSWLATIWVGTTGDTHLTVRLGLAGWVVVTTLGTGLTMFLNGAGVLRQQALIAVVSTVVMLVLKYWGAVSFGAGGMVIFMLVAYVVTTLLPYGLLVRATLRSSVRVHLEA